MPLFEFNDNDEKLRTSAPVTCWIASSRAILTTYFLSSEKLVFSETYSSATTVFLIISEQLSTKGALSFKSDICW